MRVSVLTRPLSGFLYSNELRHVTYQPSHDNTQGGLDQTIERIVPRLHTVIENDDPANVSGDLGGVPSSEKLRHQHRSQDADSDSPGARHQYRAECGSADRVQDGCQKTTQSKLLTL